MFLDGDQCFWVIHDISKNIKRIINNIKLMSFIVKILFGHLNFIIVENNKKTLITNRLISQRLFLCLIIRFMIMLNKCRRIPYSTTFKMHII